MIEIFREYETFHHPVFVSVSTNNQQITTSQEKSTPNHPQQSHPHETMSPFCFFSPLLVQSGESFSGDVRNGTQLDLGIVGTLSDVPGDITCTKDI